MTDLRKQISKRIVGLREDHHLTQEKLAEILNISIKHCSSVERGVAMLSLEKLVELANYFDVSLDYLLRGADQLNVPSQILEIYQTSDQEEQKRLERYLQMYVDLRNK